MLQAKAVGALSSRPLKELVDQCWNLGEVAAEYQSFIDRFRSVARALHNASALDPEQCFVTRTLLMHEFRRVQLRDPSLPRQLLAGKLAGRHRAGDVPRHLPALLAADRDASDEDAGNC